MSETTIPAAEAAKDFLKLLDLVERNHEPAVIVREGKAVAMINPMPGPAVTSTELAEHWSRLDRLAPDEANAFADDIEAARRNLPPLKSTWD
jgi:hypothetical protein